MKVAKKLAAIPGIDPITASAMIATTVIQKWSSISNLDWTSAKAKFKRWKTISIGCLPKGHTSKHGDSYLQTLLIHESRSMVHHANTSDIRWLMSLSEWRSKNAEAVLH